MLSLFAGMAASSSSFETVYLADGSVLEGFIKVQENDTLVFNAERATICLPMSVIDTKYDCEYKWEELDSVWQQSGEIDKADTVILNDIVLSRVISTPTWSIASSMTQNPKVVKILEDGDVVKYLDLKETEYKLNFDVVERIVRQKNNDKLLVSGVTDQITTSDDEVVSGQIVEMVPANYVKIDVESGSIRNIKYDNITKMMKVGRNPAQSLVEQTEYIDNVVYKDEKTGATCEISGVVSVQDYGANKLTVVTKDNKTTELAFDAVVRFEKLKNKDYNPIRDIVLSDTEILVNSKLMKFRPFEKLSNGKINMKTGEFGSNEVVLTSQELVVEMRDNDCNRAFVLFPFETVTQFHKHGKHRVFDFSDMMMSKIEHKTESVNPRNKVLKRVYKLDVKYQPKYFVLYNVKENKGLLITPVYR